MASRNPDLPKAPPDIYAWNNLIQDIIEAMNEADVLKIKRRFEGIIQVPTSIQTAEQLMEYLKQNGYISECNIVYLQQIVRVLKKKELLQKAINYANKSSQKVLHFRVTETVLRPGFEIVKVHVEGDFAHATKDYLQKLRHTISDITQVPHEDISIVGVKETNSFIITLMLPKMYVEVFQDLLGNTKKHYLFVPLLEIKVDEIIVSEKSFKINVDRENSKTLEKSGKEENVSGLNLKMEHELHRFKKSNDMSLEDKTANQTVGRKRKSVFVEQDDTEGIRKKLQLGDSWPKMERLEEKYRQQEMHEYIVMN